MRCAFEIDLMTFMLVMKAFIDTGTRARPFLSFGLGLMHGEATASASALGTSASASIDETDGCFSIGLGTDFLVTVMFFVGIEGDYVLGIGDMDDTNFVNFTLGFGFLF